MCCWVSQYEVGADVVSIHSALASCGLHSEVALYLDGVKGNPKSRGCSFGFVVWGSWLLWLSLSP